MLRLLLLQCFCGVTMPTNAELAKRIEELEESFDRRGAKAVGAAVSSALSKLQPEPASGNERLQNEVAECQDHAEWPSGTG